MDDTNGMFKPPVEETGYAEASDASIEKWNAEEEEKAFNFMNIFPNLVHSEAYVGTCVYKDLIKISKKRNRDPKE